MSVSACLPLKGTTVCPLWDSYSVWSPIKTVAEFDAYVGDSLPTSPKGIEFWKSQLVCPGFAGGEVPYFQSTWCASMVDVATVRFGCNKNLTATPRKALCRSAVSQLTTAVTRLIGSSACTNGTAAAAARLNGTIQREVLAYAANTTETNCQKFDNACGYSNFTLATAFCDANNKTAAGACCASLVAPPAPFFDILPPAPVGGLAKWLYEAATFNPDMLYGGIAVVGLFLAILVAGIMIVKKDRDEKKAMIV